MALKRGLEHFQDVEVPWKRQSPDAGITGPTLKLLLTEPEAVAVYGWSGQSLAEIQTSAGAEMKLSSPEQLYPGTALRELSIRGDAERVVLGACAQVFMKITTGVGSLCSCEAKELKPGDARIKLIIPVKAAKAILGNQGLIVKQLRDQTGAHIHIENQVIPVGPLVAASEQVLSLDGPLSGIQVGLQRISQQVSLMINEPWFSSWASTSHCGTLAPMLPLFQDHTWEARERLLRTKAERKGQQNQLDSGPYVIKLLVYDFEGSAVLGAGGARIRDMSAASGTKMMLSHRNEFYPGTQLQELRVWGKTEESVLDGAMHALRHIATAGKPKEEADAIWASSEGGPGPHMEVRMKLVVPLQVLKKLMDNGGGLAKQLQDQSSLTLRIGEEGVAAQTLLVEQVLNLAGPLAGARVALTFISALCTSFLSEPWFTEWSALSQCVKTDSSISKELPGAAAPASLYQATGENFALAKAMDIAAAAVGQGMSAESIALPSHSTALAALASQGISLASQSQAGPLDGITFAAQAAQGMSMAGQAASIAGQASHPVQAITLADQAAQAAQAAETAQAMQTAHAAQATLQGLAMATAGLTQTTQGFTMPGLGTPESMSLSSPMIPPPPPPAPPAQGLTMSGMAMPSAAATSPAHGLSLMGASLQATANTGMAMPSAAATSPAHGLSLMGAPVQAAGNTGMAMPSAAATSPAHGLSLMGAPVQAAGNTGIAMSSAAATTPAHGLPLMGAPVQAPGNTGDTSAPGMFVAPPAVQNAGKAGIGKGKENMKKDMLALMIQKKGMTGKGQGEKGMKGMMIQMELLMEMEIMMEKELLAEMDAMGKGAQARVLLGKGMRLADVPSPLNGNGMTNTDSSNRQAAHQPGIPDAPPGAMQSLAEHTSTAMALSQPSLAPPAFPAAPSLPDVAQKPPPPPPPPPLAAPGLNGQPHPPPITAELPSARGVPMAIKFLADANEVQFIKGQDVALVQLQLKTKSRIVVSDETFPGCIGLQEIRVLGESAKAVLAAMIAILTKVTEITGRLCCGEPGVEFGHARIKMLVPARAAAAVIGPGGQNVKELNQHCGVKTHVDMSSIPCTRDMAEQAICLAGTMTAVCQALPTILGHIATFAAEKWFKAWITTSNAGKTIPGLVLWATKGKSKGGMEATAAEPSAVASTGMSPPKLDESVLMQLLVQQQELLASMNNGSTAVPPPPPPLPPVS